MAQSRRVERVASLIRREVSELMIGGIKDDRVNQGMVSVTSVEVAGEDGKIRMDCSSPQAMAGLGSASAYVKGELGRRLKMRRTPEVVFVLDRGIEKGTSVLGLLNRLEGERQTKGEPAEASEF